MERLYINLFDDKQECKIRRAAKLRNRQHAGGVQDYSPG